MLEENLDGVDAEGMISCFSREGEHFLRSLVGNFSLALFDSNADVLYLIRGVGGTPIYFSGDIRLVFATSEEALATFPERLFGITCLRENSILKYDIQGVRFI